jgi:hypothetical protein
MAQAIYTVTINDDGTVSTTATAAGEGVSRQATPYDILQTSKELVSEIQNRILVNRVAQAVLNALTPVAEPTVAETVADALSDRGIETAQN